MVDLGVEPVIAPFRQDEADSSQSKAAGHSTCGLVGYLPGQPGCHWYTPSSIRSRYSSIAWKPIGLSTRSNGT